jgi:hypothetical protein
MLHGIEIAICALQPGDRIPRPLRTDAVTTPRKKITEHVGGLPGIDPGLHQLRPQVSEVGWCELLDFGLRFNFCLPPARGLRVDFGAPSDHRMYLSFLNLSPVASSNVFDARHPEYASQFAFLDKYLTNTFRATGTACIAR